MPLLNTGNAYALKFDVKNQRTGEVKTYNVTDEFSLHNGNQTFDKISLEDFQQLNEWEARNRMLNYMESLRELYNPDILHYDSEKFILSNAKDCPIELPRG